MVVVVVYYKPFVFRLPEGWLFHVKMSATNTAQAAARGMAARKKTGPGIASARARIEKANANALADPSQILGTRCAFYFCLHNGSPSNISLFSMRQNQQTFTLWHRPYPVRADLLPLDTTNLQP